jgi:hypothetical protein
VALFARFAVLGAAVMVGFVLKLASDLPPGRDPTNAIAFCTRTLRIPDVASRPSRHRNADRRRLQEQLGQLSRTSAPVHADAAVMAAAHWAESVLVASISYRE